MTLSWDPTDERVVIEVFPYSEAAVLGPDQPDDEFEEPEPDEVFLVRLPAGPRARVREAGRAGPRGRPAQLPVLRRPDRPRRPPVRPGQRLPAPRSVTAEPSVDLVEGELVLHGRIMPASNATFVGEIDGLRVVYKPVAGERPLWDFPDGTLADRERAAYLVSEAFGWDVVPETWLRDGPHGPGMVQRWQEPDERAGGGDARRRG